MADDKQGTGVVLKDCDNGVWKAPGARIIDRTGRRMLPIGRDSFVVAAQGSVVIDKTMLAADVIDSGYSVILFCRPRRFGKTLNMRMLQAFFELPSISDPTARNRAPLFEGTEVWEARDGYYRQYQGIYPTVYLNLNTVKKLAWHAALGALRNIMVMEYARFGYLADSPTLNETQKAFYERVVRGEASDAELADSLEALCRMLYTHHGMQVVLLVDEYDAPVMAGYTNGYYREVVDFLKGWLTGALKGGGDFLAFSCLTGVQRISKESIFSDLNNLRVSTALGEKFEERFGFSEREVMALASYLGHDLACMEEARLWYDGYRFGDADIYNPWSILNYFDADCTPDVYWGNTSGNSVIGQLMRASDEDTMQKVYDLFEPGGYVSAPIDLGAVFPDDLRPVAPGMLWSMLYLAGYLTTPDTMLPNNVTMRRRLRIPNKEIASVYRSELIERYARAAGGGDRLGAFHDALVAGDAEQVRSQLDVILRDDASCYDITSENSAHMLMLGLCFGLPGYADPRSNKEAGYGRFDIQVEPSDTAVEAFSFVKPDRRPLITVELKCLPKAEAPSDGPELAERLGTLAREALAQIACNAYDAGILPPAASGRLRWGVAFSGRHVAVACKRAE